MVQIQYFQQLHQQVVEQVEMLVDQVLLDLQIEVNQVDQVEEELVHLHQIMLEDQEILHQQVHLKEIQEEQELQVDQQVVEVVVEQEELVAMEFVVLVEMVE
jgi:hypothetical protein